MWSSASAFLNRRAFLFVGAMVERVSDICRCGRFRRDHRGSCACTEFIFSRQCTEDDLDRWVKDWYGTATPTFRQRGIKNAGLAKQADAVDLKSTGKP
jgi:hypothetical protein